ncbi:anti-sigma-D factor RsdA [Micromonospora sp. NPDC050200]|uniref:anti-sigma-D factor RsdA n=1 Tax=Micromonospora sp. NPDC050200 TaxID=3155664 RepID=UPI003411F29D
MSSGHGPDGGEELDLTPVTRDDLLLDALGRGEEGTDDDTLASMLAAWQADLTADVDGVGASSVLLAVGTDTDRRVGRVGGDLPAAAGRARSRRPGPWVLRLAAAVAAVMVLATGLGVGSRNAGPTSPLWSLTKVLHPEQAAVRTVEDTIGRAREAVAAGRLDEARQLVDQAQRELVPVTDPADVTRLRAEIDAVLRDLAAPGCPTWPQCATPPALTPAASTTTGSPRGTPSPAPPATRPASPPAEPTSRTDPLPSLPRLPLPPAPSPSVLSPLPGLPLPGLPLPTGGLLD